MSIEILQKLQALQNQVDRLEAADAGPIVARYTLDSGTAPSAVTVVNFDTLEYDPLGLVTTGASWRFTCPIGGHYAIQPRVLLEPAGVIPSGKLFVFDVYLNGVAYSRVDTEKLSSAVNGPSIHLHGPDLVCAAKDDYIDVRITHTHTSSIPFSTNILVNYIYIFHVDRTL